MGAVRFISDLHFGHKNILAFDNRPFKTIEEHDQAIIDNWKVVNPDDDVWILGDISWHSAEKTAEILRRLGGRKHICVGNHDRNLLKNKIVREQFVEICDYKEMVVGTNGIVTCHYPVPCFNKHFYGWLHFYGHVHNSFEWNMMERVRYEMESLYDKKCNMINVGCMMPYMNFTPKTAEEILYDYSRWNEQYPNVSVCNLR